MQDDRYASYTAKRTAKDGLIDWTQPAREIERLIRAVGRPYPGAFTSTGGEKLVIWAAEVWPDAFRHHAAAGQVIGLDGRRFAVRCGDGLGLLVTDWERESGKLPRLHANLGES